EVAFHDWDLQHSLGREARLDPSVAVFLLPTLLESNLPRIYAGAPGGEGRFSLVAESQPPSTWLLAADRQRLEVTRRSAEADVPAAASPDVIALLIYGRVKLVDEERQGRLRLIGDRSLAERFGEIFPTP